MLHSKKKIFPFQNDRTFKDEANVRCKPRKASVTSLSSISLSHVKTVSGAWITPSMVHDVHIPTFLLWISLVSVGAMKTLCTSPGSTNYLQSLCKVVLTVMALQITRPRTLMQDSDHASSILASKTFLCFQLESFHAS